MNTGSAATTTHGMPRIAARIDANQEPPDANSTAVFTAKAAPTTIASTSAIESASVTAFDSGVFRNNQDSAASIGPATASHPASLNSARITASRVRAWPR